MFQFFVPHTPAPTSTDPADYPVAVKITDEEARWKLAEVASAEAQATAKGKALLTLQREYDVLAARYQLAVKELWLRLDALHPEVGERCRHAAYRRHGEETYLVGWDPLDGGPNRPAGEP
jgi:hypothetical protein